MLEISDLGRDCTIRVAKTKVLISFAVTPKLICVFVFANAKIRFSHDVAHIKKIVLQLDLFTDPPITSVLTFEPRCEKTGLWGFRPGPTQTGLYSQRPGCKARGDG